MRSRALLSVIVGLTCLGLAVLPAGARAANGQHSTAGTAELLLRHPRFVADEYADGDFKLVYQGQAADLYVDPDDQPGVARALGDLQNDIAMVTDLHPVIKNDVNELAAEAVLVGTIGHSLMIDHLIDTGKLDAEGIAGKWEAYVIRCGRTLAGVAKGLVIAGSDRRGTIYGIYELSRQIGYRPGTGGLM